MVQLGVFDLFLVTAMEREVSSLNKDESERVAQQHARREQLESVRVENSSKQQELAEYVHFVYFLNHSYDKIGRTL